MENETEKVDEVDAKTGTRVKGMIVVLAIFFL